MTNLICRISKWAPFAVAMALISAGDGVAAGKDVPEVETLTARIKAGASYYTHLTGATISTPSNIFGVDAGFELGDGFGVILGGRMITDASGIGEGTNSAVSVNSRYFGVAPSYSVTKGRAVVTASMGLGIMSSTVSTTATGNLTTQNSSKLAFAPAVDIDINLDGGLILNAGVQYILSSGSGQNPWVFAPMAGIGLQF